MHLDPWVPSGLAAALLSIVAATAIRDGDTDGAWSTGILAAAACFSAIQSYRRHEGDDTTSPDDAGS
jgi:hypothetical protein